MRFAAILLALAFPAALRAQADGSLTLTLPSGKVLHFQSEEQKAAFLAAKARSTGAAASLPSPSPSAPSQPTPARLGGTALDEKPTMSGKVNVGAPTFTADYYTLAPETWVGKQITLSVAYLRPLDAAPRPDGMLAFTAYTYGIVQATAVQRHGGIMTVLATPEAASRIATLAGGAMQYTGSGAKMTLIRGEFALLPAERGGGKPYGIVVKQ